MAPPITPLTSPTTSTAVPRQDARTQLMGLLTGHWVTSAVAAAAELRVADRLANGPRTATDAAGADLDPAALGRLLALLTALGLLTEDEGRFALTPTGELLRADHPTSLRELALLYEESWFRSAWDRLADGVRSGASPFALAHGRPVFGFLADHPEHAVRYGAGIAAGGFAHTFPAGIVDLADRTVVDIGGGDGSLLHTLLATEPTARGLLLERAAALPHAARTLAAHIDAGRCSLVEGDFFTEVPAGAAIYVLSRILHNWSDADATRILRAVRAAMAPGAQLLIVERVLPDDRHPVLSRAFDLHMLVMTGGRERTGSEYDTLLAAVGLRRQALHDLPLEMNVLVAG